VAERFGSGGSEVGCRRQLDSARIGSGKPEAASAGTPMRPDEPDISVGSVNFSAT
jgi:hypothetical protein